ncbi:MAG: DNA polymerase I [Clostridia bacterium]|nr:DNA polymerase I [Clostridia bacterium]
MKLLAIDGNSIINRAFYGIRLLSTKDGQYTNAVYGFINILLKLISEQRPDGVAVAFDLHAPTFRHKRYADYKAGRKPMPQELREQFPIIKEWLTLAGYSCIECEGFEADDILGTLAATAEKNENECVIATGDRDSLQLVSENTHVLLTVTRMGQNEITDYTPDKLYEKYSLDSSGMIELKALMGDSSDNIPGVPGIGQKTATDLIVRFSNIDNIYENLDSIDVKESVRAKLAVGKDSAYLSRELGTICKTAPIDTDFEHYRTRPAKVRELSSLMTRLELFKLLERMNIRAVSAEQKNANEEKNFSAGTFDDIKENADIYIGENEFAAVSNGKVADLSEEQLVSVLENEKISKRVYDSKSLYKKYGMRAVTFDAMLAAYLVNPASNDYSLSRLFAEYGILDKSSGAVAFSMLCDILAQKLEADGEAGLLSNIELPLARVLASMEKEGFLVDRDGISDYSRELSDRIDELTRDIYALSGGEFNINSPKQLGEILFVKLGLPAKKKTKSGYSTNAEVLEDLRYDYPIVDLILKYRRLTKLKSTYCEGLLSAVSDDGRIHSTFNQTEARTGRISSLEPNLQNIPVRTEEGKRFREFFVAKEGCVLCDADYSQIELRVLASLADDEVMIDAFSRGVDIHTLTASEVFNIPIDMVLPIMRSRAKAVNFGIVYGIGAFSLAKDIGVSRAEAQKYINGYLSTYKGVSDYMDRVIKNAKRDGFVTTFFGRRRYLPELSASNGMLRAFGERVARNAPIQGTAADIIKIAMIKVHNRLSREVEGARLILQVHDELIVECKEADKDRVCRILEEEMQNAASLKVKLSVDAHWGRTWLEAKG